MKGTTKQEARKRDLLRSGLALSLLVLAGIVISVVRPRVVEDFDSLRTKTDVYALPSPEQAIVASLGYRSALADLIFAHVLVSYGIHFEQKRLYEYAPEYLDTITALDPSFRDPYYLADTLIILQPVDPPKERYRRARTILERGLEAFPDDAELALVAGQFMAYLAYPHLPADEDKKEWRIAGARVLAHACDMLGAGGNIPHHCVTAASLFSRAGEREATVRSLRRVLAISDNEEVRQKALAYLRRIESAQLAEDTQTRLRAMDEMRQNDLPLVDRAQFQLIAPATDPFECAGVRAAQNEGCASSFESIAASIDQR